MVLQCAVRPEQHGVDSMAITLIPAGVSAAAKALMKTPAGQKIAAKGGKAVRDFLEKKGLYSRGTGKKPIKGSNKKTVESKTSSNFSYKPKTKGKALKALRKFQGNKPKEVDARKMDNLTTKRAREEAVKNSRGQRANRFGYEGLKAGGLVKKKGIDGIAKRGKTKATRSR